MDPTVRHDFSGKVALITGGTSGIGLACARSFARGGAKVVIAARGAQRGEQVARDLRVEGHEVAFLRCDVARDDEVQALVAGTVERFGRLDYAVNNAAADEGVLKPAAAFDEAEFDRVMAANLKGVWLCMKHQIARMLAQAPTGGAIVNTSSVGSLMANPTLPAYSAMKRAVNSLTESAAVSYGPEGIRVNAIAPGTTLTEMIRGWEAEVPGIVDQLNANTPLRRAADPSWASR